MPSMNRPPENSPAYRELYRIAGGRYGGVRRWSGEDCQQIPDGMKFWQLDRGDRQRYEQAGCEYLGAQSARRSLVVGGSGAGSMPTTVFTDAWCCQPNQVVPVFEQWVASSEYQKNKNLGLYFAGAMILGIGYLMLNYKKFGGKMSGKRTQRVSWAANPGVNIEVERVPVYREDTERAGWVESYDIIVEGVVVAAVVKYTPQRASDPKRLWSIIPNYLDGIYPDSDFLTKKAALDWIDKHAEEMLDAEEGRIDKLADSALEQDEEKMSLGPDDPFVKLLIESQKISDYRPELRKLSLAGGINELGIVSDYDVYIRGVRVGSVYMMSVDNLERPGDPPWRVSLYETNEPQPNWNGYSTKEDAFIWFKENAEQIYESSVESLSAKKAPVPVLSSSILSQIYTIRINDDWTEVCSKDSDYHLGSVVMVRDVDTGEKVVKAIPIGAIKSKKFDTVREALSYVVTYAKPKRTMDETIASMSKLVEILSRPCPIDDEDEE